LPVRMVVYWVRFPLEVTGIVRYAEIGEVVGVKVTLRVQEVEGARLEQVEVAVNAGELRVGVAICSRVELVLVRVMVCWVAVGPGRLLKMRVVGLRARPGSGVPVPVSWAVAVRLPACRLRVPVRGRGWWG
jgi:hypothetical protein